jgi:hypothetical protein
MNFFPEEATPKTNLRLNKEPWLYLQDVFIGLLVIRGHIQTDEHRVTVLTTECCKGLHQAKFSL